MVGISQRPVFPLKSRVDGSDPVMTGQPGWVERSLPLEPLFLHEKTWKHGSPYHQSTLALIGGEVNERGYHNP